MGEISEQLVNEEMFDCGDKHYEPKISLERTPSEKKIAAIRKEIAINIKNGMGVQEARKNANIKYGKGWRERGLVSNSDNQWSEEDLLPYQ